MIISLEQNAFFLFRSDVRQAAQIQEHQPIGVGQQHYVMPAPIPFARGPSLALALATGAIK